MGCRSGIPMRVLVKVVVLAAFSLCLVVAECRSLSPLPIQIFNSFTDWVFASNKHIYPPILNIKAPILRSGAQTDNENENNSSWRSTLHALFLRTHSSLINRSYLFAETKQGGRKLNLFMDYGPASSNVSHEPGKGRNPPLISTKSKP